VSAIKALSDGISIGTQSMFARIVILADYLAACTQARQSLARNLALTFEEKT